MKMGKEEEIHKRRKTIGEYEDREREQCEKE